MVKKGRAAKGRMSDTQVEEAARQFTVLSEPARLMLLRELMEGESSVGELAKKTGIKQGTVSKHLGVLTTAGFVERRREGALAIHRISDPMVRQVCELMCRRVSAEAAKRAEKLASR